MTQEREHARATNVAESPASNDAELAPGRTSLSAQLGAPANPLISGLVQRKAERDANGVAAGADAAIAAASSSSGSALPETIQRKFEASLGADLSSVRVHTGGESQTAAHAVGAKAYTIGQDIHFGAGHYDPSSAAGEHLLAHEVAHTVQQQGGTTSRQNKLEVSTPFDAAEHEADRAADAMVSGGRATISGFSGLARKVMRGADKPQGGGEPAEGGGGPGISFEYSNGEFKITEFAVGPYVKAEVTAKPTAKVSGSKAGAEGEKPAGGDATPKDPTGAPADQKQAEDTIKKTIDAALKKVGGGPVEGEAGAGIKYDKEKKSVTLGGGFSLSSDFGHAKVEVAPLEVSLASWDPKKGLSGPKVGASATAIFPVWKTTIAGIKLDITVSMSLGIEFTPNWTDIAAWVMSDVGAAAIADIGLVCVPAASAAAVFAGLYFAQQEGEDIGQISAAAAKALQAYCESYANVMTGGAAAGGAGAAEGAAKATADLATLKSHYPEAIVAQKAQEIGIYSKVVEAARPAFRARAEEEFKKKHSIRTALFGVPPDFYMNLDARLNNIGNKGVEKSVGLRNDDGST